ncbi:MAG TPA: universal stress protein [Dongiaceae bacterium]|nr:universal stress protein [Dongiaceae bacterium]
MLLATDGSSDAHAAVTWLAQFPVPSASRLRVVSALSIPPSALDLPTVRDFIASLREEAQRTTESARAQLAARFGESETRVVEGEARETILREAEEWRADLIVLGARGLGMVAGLLLGSVSLGVARHARCSVLVVKAGSHAGPGILIGIDGSPHAASAAAFVARLPLDPTTPVRLTAVVLSPTVPGTTPSFAQGIVREAIHEIVKERTAAAEQAIATAAGPLEGLVKKVERQVVVGHPASALLTEAARAEIGLIVVGARGLGTVERWLLGSVSENILRHANRPVLIVKEPAR